MKLTKLSILALGTILLAGCEFQNPFAPKNEPTVVTESSSSTENSSSIASSSADTNESSSTESMSATSSEMTTSESTASEASAEKTITFNFYVGGESVGSFKVENAVGKSILDAMKSNEEIKFTFNENDGVIDTIFDTVNDYEAGNTWIYLLNDQMAEKGVVSQTLSEGDRIDWHFGTVDELPVTIIPAAE